MSDPIDMGNWVACERDHLARQIGDGTLLRTALTTDAGVGKSINLEQLQFHITRDCPNKIVCRIKLGDLETRFGNRVLTPNQFLAQYIVDVVFRSCLPFQNASDRPRIERWLDRSARVGSLVLLVDELDQVAVDSIANTTLVDALGDSLFSKCPVVVAGRPYAIQDRWSSLFANRSWTYFQLDGFNTEQQKTFFKGPRRQRSLR
jgi:hypothetical protein